MVSWRLAIKSIGISLLLFSSALHAEIVQLSEIVLLPVTPNYRLVLTLSSVPTYTVFSLQNPDRIVVDLRNTRLATTFDQLDLEKAPLKSIRSGIISKNGLRLVIDLKQPLQTSVAILKPDKRPGRRLVIDLGKNFSLAKEVNDKELNAPEARATDKTKSAKTIENMTIPSAFDIEVVSTNVPVKVAPKVSTVEKKPKRNFIIVIDPGHGGKDSGAIGPTGKQEKNIVLQISRELQSAINQTPGMRAVMTRNGDYFISLRERLRLARKAKADMFIAVHADAFNNPYSMGSSVYALSLRGASSEAARWLAEKENYSELGGVNLDDKSDVLRSVLIDLSQTATISASLQVGSAVLQQLGKISRLHHQRVEQARFVVLKSPDIPSLLVETGFITNPIEEQRLSDEAYQQRLANAMLTGIASYFKRTLPHTSAPQPLTVETDEKYIEVEDSPIKNKQIKTAPIKKKVDISKLHVAKKHIVKPGETLAIIAKKYTVDLDILKQFNHISSTGVRAGQTIRIPAIDKS